MVLTKEELKTRLSYLYRELDGFFLFPVRCSSRFCPNATFSSVNLRLSVVEADSGNTKVAFPFTKILEPLDSLKLSGHDLQTLLGVVQARQIPWPPSLVDLSTMSKKQVFILVAEKILCLVAENITLETKYSEQIKAKSLHLQFGSNGMGDPLVWHGFADGFLNMSSSVNYWDGTPVSEIDSYDYEEILYSSWNGDRVQAAVDSPKGTSTLGTQCALNRIESSLSASTLNAHSPNPD